MNLIRRKEVQQLSLIDAVSLKIGFNIVGLLTLASIGLSLLGVVKSFIGLAYNMFRKD